MARVAALARAGSIPGPGTSMCHGRVKNKQTKGLLGTWLGSLVSKNETHAHGETLTRFLTSAEGHRHSKKCTRQTKDPPLFLPNAGDAPVPFPWVRSGRTFFPVGSLKQIVAGKRGKQEGGRRGISAETEQNGVAKISFDTKDIMLLSTVGFRQPLLCSGRTECQKGRLLKKSLLHLGDRLWAFLICFP